MTRHEVQFGFTAVLSKALRFWDRVILESVEVQLDLTTVNRDVGLQLTRGKLIGAGLP